MMLLLFACAAEPTPVATTAPVIDCSGVPDVTWNAWAEGFFRTYCTACHSSENTTHRSGAPVGVDVDTEAAVRALAPDIRRVVLDEPSMPRSGGIQEDDRVLLDVYLSCFAD